MLYQRGETWYVDIQHKGERVRRTTGSSSKEEARRIHDAIRAALWQRNPHSHTWVEAVGLWIDGGKRGIKDQYRLRALPADPLTPLHDITGDMIIGWLAGQKGGNFNRTRGLVVAILNGAKALNWIDVVPVVPRRDAPKGRIRWLTHEEWQALKPELAPHLRQMARFALATGLRQHNVTHLEWGQVDMGRKVAWVHADEAKGGEAIGVPLAAEAMEVLREQRGQNKVWVFPLNGKPIAQINTGWKAAIRRAGIRPLRWHDLRHTWASWHVMAGTPLEVLQKLGGWADIRMVLRYAHLAPEHLARYADNAKPKSLQQEAAA